MAGDPEKERFLEEFCPDYGYPDGPKNVDEIRATEFKRLNDMVYLDHAGATLYSEKQMQNVMDDFNSSIYGNPHSQSNCGMTTCGLVEEARLQVLRFFNACPGEYKCIFTSGATAALKLLGETFPWSPSSVFMYTMENHNSVLGMREYALGKGASAVAVDIEDAIGRSGTKIIPHSLQRRDTKNTPQTSEIFNLFAFPSECNFSGLRFKLNLVDEINEGLYELPAASQKHRGKWKILIDAAKGSATAPPDLSKHKADFVVVSFYKLFGYPTGIGALIARNESANLLNKTYFGGGTVAASIADFDLYKRRENVEEYLEDGTLNFLSIASLRQGFKILNQLTMPAIQRHTTALASYVRNALVNLRHMNGIHVCTVYGVNQDKLLFDGMGPIVSFNLRRPDGSWFGYREVEKLASLSNIQLRTGCFCNPGACAKLLGLSHADLQSNIEAGHVCWDDYDILKGKPTGAVRVSFGYMSTFEDARKFLKFIESSFVSLPYDLFGGKTSHLPNGVAGIKGVANSLFLKSVIVYPIKSCAGFSVDSWPLCDTGLLHDREWLLKSMGGDILTQKKVPEMGLITTLVDLKLGLLLVESPRCKQKLKIELTSEQCSNETGVMEIYSQRHEVQGYSDTINQWFSDAVGRPCMLVRSCSSQKPICPNRNGDNEMCRDAGSRLSFVNEAQFLLVSVESVGDLNSRLKSKFHDGANNHCQPIQIDPSRFRPNLVVSGGYPFAEDQWKTMKIGGATFTSLGGCNRCQMINMTPKNETMQRSNEPLATLASYRRSKGKIYFGILLKLQDCTEQGAWLSAGQEVIANAE